MQKHKTVTLLALLLTITLATLPAIAQTARPNEFSLEYMPLDGDTTTFDNDSEIDGILTLDDIDLYGIGATFHKNKHFAYKVSISFGSATLNESKTLIDANDLPIEDIEEKLDSDVFVADFNINYYILDEPITPMLTGGVGLMSFFGDYSQTNFTFNAGAGLRAEIIPDLTIEALYRTTWLKIEDADDLLALEGYSLSILFKF